MVPPVSGLAPASWRVQKQALRKSTRTSSSRLVSTTLSRQSSTLAGPSTSERMTMLLIGALHLLSEDSPRLSSWRLAHSPLFPAFHREENRKDEIKKLTAEGKLPHEVELEKHPELSAKTRPCTFSFLYAIQSLLLNNIFDRADGQGCGKNRRE